jgi:hypothetical protein
MHARLEQLLSLRDGEPVDALMREHIAGCPSCAAELARLATSREQLCSLPMFDPPSELWAQIAERISKEGLHEATTRRNWKSTMGLAAAFLAVVIVLFRMSDQSSVRLLAVNHAAEPELSALVQRSQQLEAALDSLPRRPSVERVATAANIDGIEQRIQWLDFHLSAANDVLDESQTQQLWQERVNLMDSLVKLRYVEARTAQL